MDQNETGPHSARNKGQKKINKKSTNYISDSGNFVNIPRELKELPQWVCWKLEPTDGGNKKKPITPRTFEAAKVSSKITWGTYNHAVSWFEGHCQKGLCGIGLVLTKDDPYCVIDIDGCINPETGELEPDAKEIVTRIGSCTEVSPSGSGLHIFFRGDNPFPRNRSISGKIEIYDSKRYMTVTGNAYGGIKDIHDRQQEVKNVLGPYFDCSTSSPPAPNPSPQDNSLAICLPDEQVLEKARTSDKFNRLWAGDISSYGNNHSSADMALCTMLAFLTENPKQIDRFFRDSDLMRNKWDERHRADGATYGQMTIEKAIKWVQNNRAKREQSGYDEEGQVPVLDKEALCGLAGRFVELATRDNEANPAAVLITFLVRAGVEFGSGIRFMVGDTKHFPRLFAAVVGDSSKSRKGTSASPVERFFKFSKVPNSPGPLSTGEGLIYAVQDSIGTENKSLFVMDEEFGAALSCAKRDGNTLSTVLRSAWDKGNLDPLTKHDKISATNAHIGIVFHITRTELDSKMQKTEAFNGFANRILWTSSNRLKLLADPPRMPKGELEALRNEFRSNLQKVAKTTELHRSSEAKKFWREIYSKLSEERYGLLGCVINRAEAQVLRISMVYCLLDGSSIIEVPHLESALAVWDYCEKSATLIFGDRESDPTFQKILDFLKPGPKTRTEISRLFWGHKSKRDLDAVLGELQRRGRISVEKKTGTGGAFKTIYKLVQH